MQITEVYIYVYGYIHGSTKELPERLPGGLGRRDRSEKAEIFYHVEEEPSGATRCGRFLDGGRDRGRRDIFTSIGQRIVRGTASVVSGGSCNDKELGDGALRPGLNWLVSRVPEVGNVGL
jgi:hypothetical protein